MSHRQSSVWIAVCVALSSACGGAGARYTRADASEGAWEGELLNARRTSDIEYSRAERSPSEPLSGGGETRLELDASGPAGLLAMRERSEEARSDARDVSGPLLVYTATLFLAVFEVQATQDALVERARTFGGVMTHRGDDRLVVRIPAGRFEEYLAGVGELGDVLHREVTAEDVGEEFRDVSLRIRNLDVVRQRLEALLSQANTVEAALSVQRELERVTTELESLRGRQRYLADRVALSTITFAFRAQPRETLERTTFRLPFPWLDSLGLSSLLEVH